MPFYKIEGRGDESGRQRKCELCAPSRRVAEQRTADEGITPGTIDEQPYWHVCGSVVGATHKNADNTSRQTIINKCRRRDRLCLQLEVGNTHDKHAAQVLLPSGEIAGYLPVYIASDFIECWHNVPGGCTYSATVLEIEPLGDRGPLVTLRILIFVALTSADSKQVANYVARTAAALGSDLVPANLMPTEKLSSQQRPAYQPVGKPVDKQISWQVEEPMPMTATSKTKGKGGCLSMILLIVTIVVAVNLLLRPPRRTVRRHPVMIFSVLGSGSLN